MENNYEVSGLRTKGLSLVAHFVVIKANLNQLKKCPREWAFIKLLLIYVTLFILVILPLNILPASSNSMETKNIKKVLGLTPTSNTPYLG